MDNGFLSDFLSGAASNPTAAAAAAAAAAAGLFGRPSAPPAASPAAEHLSSLAAVAAAGRSWASSHNPAAAGFPGAASAGVPFPPPPPAHLGAHLGDVHRPHPQPPQPLLPPPPPSAPSAAAGEGLLKPSPSASLPVSPRDVPTSTALHGRSALTPDAARTYMSPARETLFSHGLSPLDRGGLFPSHGGGILDPLSTPFAAPQRPPSASPSPLFHQPFRDSDPFLRSLRENTQADVKVPKNLGIGKPSATATSSSVAVSLAATVHGSATQGGLGTFLKQERDSSDADEVLVDDFDGQCCRTYPYNHSRIQRWQRERRKRKSETSAEAPKKERSESFASPSHQGKHQVGQEARGASSAAKVSKPSDSPAIPVGIAIGRQRQLDSEKRFAENFFRGVAAATAAGSGAAKGDGRSRPPSSCGAAAVPPHGAPPPGAHPAPPVAPPPQAHGAWPPPVPHPGSHPMWGAAGAGSHPPPPAVPYPPHMAPWLQGGGVSPAGPIPMGYQLAKDPLTGQLLLIPTDSSMPTPNPPGWPPSPYDAATASLLSSLGGHPHHPLGLPPTAANASRDAAQAHYHHMYLQQQQHIQYLQAAAASRNLLHASAAAATSTSSTLTPSTQRLTPQTAAKREPETITVSSDDDEVVTDTKTSLSIRKENPQIAGPEEKPFAPSASQEKVTEPAKSPRPSTSSSSPIPKVEMNAEEPDVSSATRQQSKSIKKEPLNLSAEEATATDSTAVTSSPTEATETPAQIKSEPAETLSSSAPTVAVVAKDADVSSCVEALMSMAAAAPEVAKQSDGLDLLLQGMEVREQEEASRPSAVDILCSASQRDAIGFGLHKKYLNVDLLCNVTQEDFVYQQNYVDPLVILRRQYNVHSFRSVERESAVKEFIAAKIRQHTSAKEEGLGLGGSEEGEAMTNEEKYLGLKSLEKVVKQIRNTEIMSQLEVELRAMMVQIQTEYREKQKELARLKASPKKKARKNSSKQRGPGRPKKRKLKSLKSKMGRPRKKPPPMPTIPSEDEEQEELEEEKPQVPKADEEDLSPPVLEPCGPAAFVSQFGRRGSGELSAKSTTASANAVGKQAPSSGLLKPPKLTASLSPPYLGNGNKRGDEVSTSSSSYQQHQNSVTNLSTIHSKFMRGKANPFANLMKLAVPTSSSVKSAPGSEKDDNEEEEEDEGMEEEEEEVRPIADQEDEEDEEGTNSDAYASSRGTISSPPPLKHQGLDSSSKKESDVEDGSGASKRRKSEKPRKHTGSTETIVPKKPRNLFMMSLSMQQRGFKVKDPVVKKQPEDQYEFHEEEEEEEEEQEEEEAAAEEEEEEELDVDDDTEEEKRSKNSTPRRRSSSGKNSPASFTGETKTVARRSSMSPRLPPPSKKEKRSTSSSSHSGTEVWSTVNPKGTEKEAAKDGKTPEKKNPQPKTKAAKSETKKKTPREPSPEQNNGLPDPTLKPSDLGDDLGDGVRILTLTDGRFWPSIVRNTQLDGVFAVSIENARQSKSIIMCREDLLRDAVHYVKPSSKAQLPIGTRVCVYWSKEYTCLFPGTVEPNDDEDEEEAGTSKRKLFPVKDDLIEVLLDDGDRRQVDVEKVRMLPRNYPRVVYDPDPISTMRRRRVSNDSVDSGSSDLRGLHMQRPPQMAPLTSYVASTSQLTPSPRKRGTPPSAKSSNTSGGGGGGSSAEGNRKKHKKRLKALDKRKRHRSKNASGNSEDDGHLKIKLDGSFNNTTTYSIRSPGMQQHQQGRSAVSAAAAAKSTEDKDGDGDDEEEETSSESSSEESEDERGERKPGINPVTGRPLWTWMEGDEGYRRPGKGKARKRFFHRAIQRGGSGEAGSDEVLRVGDCAVFLSTARVDRPYIGRVETMWEGYGGSMMVKVKWFYHPEEIETAGKKFDLKYPGGLFESPHTDENDAQTISHACNVLPLKEFTKRRRSQTGSGSNPSQQSGGSNNSETFYYLAGAYDPTLMNVSFQPGVLKQ